MVQSSYQTRRLVLRLSCTELARPVAEYLRRNQAFLRDTEPVREPDFYTVERQLAELERDVQNSRDGRGYRFWVFPKDDTAQAIGMVALNEIVMGAFRSCFLSYRLDAAHTNQGYMTEAVEKCIEIAFEDLGLHRLEANIMPRNGASLRVAEKLGFQSEGVARKYLLVNGVWEDHVHMVLLNEGR